MADVPVEENSGDLEMLIKLAPANPGNPFQAAWRASLERTDHYKRPDPAPPVLAVRGCHMVAGVVMDISALSGISVKVLTGTERRQEIVRWRQLGYYIGMEDMGKTGAQIGAVFERDESTVYDGARRFGGLMKAYPEWLDRYEKIARGLQ